VIEQRSTGRPAGRHRVARSCVAAALAAASIVSLSACSSDDAKASKSAATSPSTTLGNTAAGSATIPLFDVPATVACGTETSTTVSVHYQTVGAKRQQLLVDGRDVPGTEAAEATLDVPVHCDTLPHTFVLVAYDSNDAKTTQQKLLTTELG
jgi:hypothetical protein